jgi:hypothetical protein
LVIKIIKYRREIKKIKNKRRPQQSWRKHEDETRARFCHRHFKDESLLLRPCDDVVFAGRSRNDRDLRWIIIFSTSKHLVSCRFKDKRMERDILRGERERERVDYNWWSHLSKTKGNSRRNWWQKATRWRGQVNKGLTAAAKPEFFKLKVKLLINIILYKYILEINSK